MTTDVDRELSPKSMAVDLKDYSSFCFLFTFRSEMSNLIFVLEVYKQTSSNAFAILSVMLALPVTREFDDFSND